MKTTIALLALSASLAIAPATANAGYADKSPLNITDFAVCTAAVMKNGQGFNAYKTWVSALDARYKVIFPNMTEKERDAYAAERVIDKRKYLNRKGIETTPAFLRFYNENCKGFEP